VTGVAVRARGWGWRHATRRAWAVRGLDLDVSPGECVLLLGPSGAGKSTLLAGLCGLLDPGTGRDDALGDEEGTLLLDGVPARRARREGVRAGQARTGLLLQDPQAQTVLSRCGDDVAFGLENHAVPPAEIWPRVADALRGVGFPYDVRHPTARLSGGERQRLALAGVLALRPGLLLLDEPTAMLDADGGRLLREQVEQVLTATGATCVVVEHRVAQWLPLVDRAVVLAPGGGAVADGPPDDVIGPRREQLAAAGVWVPGVELVPPRAAGEAGDGAGEVLLTARGLSAGPAGAGRDPDRPAPPVRDLDLEIRAGSATCVVGPNGAGKSTLALTLAGLTPPVVGELAATAALAGDLGPEPHRWRPRDLVTRIGTVFQDPRHQFLASTVADELDLGPHRMRGSVGGKPAKLAPDEIARRREELLGRLRLAHLAKANPYTLSGGEQRRLSVATVLATRPRLLVLDEPTFGQDARTWAELVDLLRGLADDGAALVVATHDDDLVAALGGGVLALSPGLRPAVAS
jgi:energy-coupling factor transporter ATP-binding protein EcfA2